MSKKIILGYWKIRGLGQHLRLLLSYSGLQFQEIQYESRDKWFQGDKINLKFDFPNLPYLIDGQFKLTQASAIARYIINRSGKTDLLGKTPLQSAKMNNIIGVLNDVLVDIRTLFWDNQHQNKKEGYLKKARQKLDYLKEFIGNKQFALGYLTLADFHLAENLYYFETFYFNQKDNYSFWWRIRHNFQNLHQIRSYYQRETAVKMPFIPNFAVVSPKFYKVKLAYWNFRGRAQIPRLLLAYSGIQFEDYQYQDRQKWFQEDKLNKGLNFPNLPYLVDHDFTITESSAIQRYICNKWGKRQLLGRDFQDEAKLQRNLSVFAEIMDSIKALFFNPNYQEAKTEILQKYRPKLHEFEKILGKNQFVFGYLTLLDFVIAEDSYYFQAIYCQQYKTQFQFLQRIRNNLNNIPQIMNYYKSSQSFNGEFLPPNAVVTIPIPEWAL